MAASLHSHPASFWQKLVDDPNSCVKVVQKEWRFALPCYYVEDIKSGIKTFLQTKIARFVPELGGIFAGHGKLSLVTPNLRILFNQPFVYVTVSGDFFIFAPSVGSTLKGVVHKKSPVYLSCLVHGLFNASLPLPANILKQDWVGSKANLQDEVLFTITKVDVQSAIPYIRGNLLEITSVNSDVLKERSSSEGYDSGISAAEESIASEPPLTPQVLTGKKQKRTQSSKKSKLQADTENDGDQDQVFPVESTETPGAGGSTKKKTQKKAAVTKSDEKSEQTITKSKRKLDADNQVNQPAKKRARRSVDQLAVNLMTELTSSILQTSFDTPKVKKEKKSKTSLDVSVDDFARSLLEQVSATFSQASTPVATKTPAGKKGKRKSDVQDAPDLDTAMKLLLERTENEVAVKIEKTPTATPSTEKKKAKKKSEKTPKATTDLSAEALEIFNSVVSAVGETPSTTPASSKKKKKQ